MNVWLLEFDRESVSEAADIRMVTRLAIMSRMLMVALCILFDVILPDHDAVRHLASTSHSGRFRESPPHTLRTHSFPPQEVRTFELAPSTLRWLFRPFTRWDAAHFLSIAENG